MTLTDEAASSWVVDIFADIENDVGENVGNSFVLREAVKKIGKI